MAAVVEVIDRIRPGEEEQETEDLEKVKAQNAPF